MLLWSNFPHLSLSSLASLYSIPKAITQKSYLRLISLLQRQLYLVPSYSGLLCFQPWFVMPVFGISVSPLYQLTTTLSTNSRGVKNRLKYMRGRSVYLFSSFALTKKTPNLESVQNIFSQWSSTNSIAQLPQTTRRSNLTSDLALDWGFFFPTTIFDPKLITKEPMLPKLRVSATSVRRGWSLPLKTRSYWENVSRYSVDGGISYINSASSRFIKNLSLSKKVTRMVWPKLHFSKKTKLALFVNRRPTLGWLKVGQKKFSHISSPLATWQPHRREREKQVKISNKVTRLGKDGVKLLTKDFILPQNLPEKLIYNSNPRRVLEFKPEPLDFYQPVVRYKPGFSTYWRHHRKNFQLKFLSTFSYRQKRLTKYILRLRRLAAYSYLRAFQLSVNSIVERSHLLDKVNSTAIILRGWVFLNGLKCTNPYTQLYVGDILTCPVLNRKLQSNLADTTLIDHPHYLEVDELTSSISLIVEPRFWDFSSPFSFPTLTAKCYNWKYIT